MQNSKFLQFVSKMSRGELIIDDNQVKPTSGDWATEYQQQYNAGPSWADEFVSAEPSVNMVRILMLVTFVTLPFNCDLISANAQVVTLE